MSNKTKRKPYLTALLTGAVSIASYIYFFTNLDLVTDYYTRGGYYAMFPILTAFYFSFVHGTFASSVISILGLQPAKSAH